MEIIGKTLDNFLNKKGFKKQIKEREYLTYWPKVVGAHIQKYTRPFMIKDQILWVEVTDSVWLYHLTMIKLKIIDGLNAEIGQETIKEIRFVNNDFHSRGVTR